ncbi:uncharacterized protein LOC129586639 [Paramacrobiotus metropolitanus]|uniref:uncharacterized protein LOC129586639 n=1 Tax=Paramacrobiotus metropolitanus TaxID=2943436 RepID=UPI002445F546|nr:uncharacterized protein LOC129586639 [Paramacrobiotus metropolitanus]
MSSYLSIHNDTDDNWYIKLSYDQKAVKVAGTILTVFGTVASAGALALKVIAVKGGMAAAATAIGATTTVLDTSLLSASSKTVELMTLGLDASEGHQAKDGSYCLRPGETKRYKMSLSLWQQCSAVRYRFNPSDPEEILIEELKMRPLFSGSSVNSERVYYIKEHLEHKFAEFSTIRRIPRPEQWNTAELQK